MDWKKPLLRLYSPPSRRGNTLSPIYSYLISPRLDCALHSRKPVKTEAVVPHDPSFGLPADARQIEKGLHTVREGTVGMRVIHRHHDILVPDFIDDDFEEF